MPLLGQDRQPCTQQRWRDPGRSEQESQDEVFQLRP